MKVRTMGYFIKEALKSFKRNSFMSIASVATVTLALFILGVFMVVVANLNFFAANLESQVEISVYLKDGLSTQQIQSVEKRIQSLPDIKDIQFVNKEQAMERLKKRMEGQEGILAALDGKNPLPNSFDVTFTHAGAVKKTAAVVSQYEEVESSHFGQDIIEQLFQITQVIRISGVALIIFLAFATLFIISNTIRLTVFARRKEIGIMKYVGATNWFIRWPFLIEGLLLGFVGGALASICVWQFYLFVVGEIQVTLAFLPIVAIYPFIWEVIGILLIIGMLMGAIGSTISLKKYMKV